MTTTTLTRDHIPTQPCTIARDRALNTVFVTALEGGIGYWSRCSRYRWGIKDDNGRVTEASDFIAVIEDEDGTEYVIDRAVITRGIRLATEHGDWNAYHKAALSALTFGNYADLDLDAETADLIVQFGLFGELVYG